MDMRKDVYSIKQLNGWVFIGCDRISIVNPASLPKQTVNEHLRRVVERWRNSCLTRETERSNLLSSEQDNCFRTLGTYCSSLMLI